MFQQKNQITNVKKQLLYIRYPQNSFSFKLVNMLNTKQYLLQ